MKWADWFTRALLGLKSLTGGIREGNAELLKLNIQISLFILMNEKYGTYRSI